MPCVSSARTASSTTSGSRETTRASAASGSPASSPSIDGRRRQPGLRRLAQDRRDPRVGVLDVVDGVLGRLLLGELDVEVDLHVRGARGEEPAGGVGAHRVEQVVERDEGARALRHRDLDAVDHEADPADQQHLVVVRVVAHRLGRVLVPGHRPVVVHAPDVDEVVEAAAELLGDVADVGGEVRRPAVGAVDHAVLVVAEGGGAEPGRAVLLVDLARVAQPLHRPLDPALVVERGLALPDVEVDAEAREADASIIAAHPLRRPAAQDASASRPVGRRPRPRRRPGTLARQRPRRTRPCTRPRARARRACTRRHGRAEVVDLGARVVEVVLARHLPGRPPRGPGTAGRPRTRRARCPRSAARSGWRRRTPR